ncbi:hypothetical protein Ciccas_011655 [Cichlidogyrus casuarinus]|uniref:Pre-mRNA splicing factor n=1 Tax=Cichlidogyrus casuarinus TaxID=1844966 RepID=A0ABD2PQM4_9PLAT
MKNNADNEILYILASHHEERMGSVAKARSILEKARSKLSSLPLIWLESVRLEARHGNKSVAESLLSKALQACPTAGSLWAELIFMAPKPQRKTKSVDALKKCEHDPIVLLAVSRMFWCERLIGKARSWFTRAVKLDSDIGDIWANFYKFELLHGTPEQQEEIKTRCVAAEPRHGEIWCVHSKNPRNWKLKPAELLQLVAEQIEIPI